MPDAFEDPGTAANAQNNGQNADAEFSAANAALDELVRERDAAMADKDRLSRENAALSKESADWRGHFRALAERLEREAKRHD